MTFFSFFKPSSNATAVPPHRLRRKPLTETQDTEKVLDWNADVLVGICIS
jgi:hypothetical protein